MADISAMPQREERVQERFVRIGVRYSGQTARTTDVRC